MSAVLSLDGNHSGQIAVLEVQTPLKGRLDSNRVRSGSKGPNFNVLAGEVRVFFIDSQRTVVGCSDYPGAETEQVLRAVERAVRGTAT